MCIEITHNRQRNKQPDKGTMDTREVHLQTISPVINSKPVHYASDGTGRDSYIVRSSGGLFNAYSPGGKLEHSYHYNNQFYTLVGFL